MTVNVLADLTALYSAIIARTTGRQVSQVGHKDKQSSFSTASLSEMLRMYRQLWYKDSGLPELADVDVPVAQRGGPARFHH